MRTWRLHMAVTLDLSQIAKRINPVLKGWLAYYGKFRSADMSAVFFVLNYRLVKWARRKYKNFRYNGDLARAWVKEQVVRTPKLFAHWQAGFVIV